MEVFDLSIAYVWEFDEDFIQMLENSFHSAGLTTYLVKEHNIQEVIDNISHKKLGFRFYFDRAWDVDETFEYLGKILSRRRTLILNPYKKVLHAIDKASMHLEFITSGLNVPYSIIIPPHKEKKEIFISVDDLAKLGRPFIIKPCNTTGGGSGVVTGAETLKEILAERIKLNEDKYILQEKVIPKMINGNRAWFRCFYAFGKVINCRWDDLTHLYSIIKPEEYALFNNKKLTSITKIIQNITELDFFSTEIAIDRDNKYIVIDYVNDQCDLRLKSKTFDGVPDEVVNDIINQMIKYIIRTKRILMR